MPKGPTATEEAGETVARRFARVAAVHGQRLAVCTEALQWTYARLDGNSDSIAARILRNNPPPEQPVALLMDHDAPLVAGILAVLKTGRRYVVLSDADSEERKRTVWDKSGASLLLADRSHGAEGVRIAGSRCVEVRYEEVGEFAGDEDIAPDVPASLTFTSGTTGGPKGVVQSHRGLLHHCDNYTWFVGITPDDRISLATPCHLAASHSSLWGALMNGAGLFPIDLRKQGVDALPGWIEKNGITLLHLVPSAFRAMAAAVIASGRRSALKSLRLVRLGGETVRRADFKLFKQCTTERCELLVAYSSTETGAACMSKLGHGSKISGERVAVGRPMPGMDVRVVDENGEELPAGESGRIVVRSRFVAQGYWKEPGLTRERFFEEADGSRTFKAGDLGRFDSDGLLEHLGRADGRIKVRGQWVNPDEVEAALSKATGGADCAVVAREDGQGQTRVVAFIATPEAAFAGTGALRRILRRSLPPPSVPSEIIRLDRLPRTSGGKVDRVALASDLRTGGPMRHETSVLEGMAARVAKVWAATLGEINVRPHDDFFVDLGGTSLDAARMVTLLEAELGRPVGVPLLLQYSTLEAFARHLEGPRPVAQVGSLTLVQEGDARRTPLFFAHGDIFGGGVYCRTLASQIGPERPFHVISPVTLAEVSPAPTVEQMARHFMMEIRTVQPNGPYLLGGFCNGGFVAYEAARQLEAAGQHVEVLVLVRTYAGRLRWPAVLRLIDQLCPWVEEQSRLALAARVLDHLQRWAAAGESRLPGIIRHAIEKAAGLREKWAGRTSPHAPVPAPPDERSGRIVDIHRRAMLSYRPRPYRGRVLIFRPVEEEGVVFGDPSTGWSRYARRFVPFTLPGEHFTCMTRYSEALAQVLTTYLRPK